MEFPFQFSDFSIEISKDWNGNSKAKRIVILGFQLTRAEKMDNTNLQN